MTKTKTGGISPKIKGSDIITFKTSFTGNEIIDLIKNRLELKNIRVYDSAIVNELRELSFYHENY